MDSTAPVATNTNINVPIPISGTESVDACDATTGWTASASDSVATTTSKYVEGTAALTLVKAATGTATCYVSKTTTSIATFASKEFWASIYISAAMYGKLKTSGTCLSIRFGTDSGNYYQKDYTKADITTTAWNSLYFNTSTATSTTGSPGTTNLDYTYISYVTENIADTTSAADFVFDDLKVASSDDYLKALAVGYPSIDSGAHTITCRGVVSSTECNGRDVKEMAVFNADGTPIIWNHDTFTTIPKNNTIEIIFEIIDSVV